MDLFNNNYDEVEELLILNCEPMREFMELTPIEVIRKIMAFYECKEDCPARCNAGVFAGKACSPFVDRGDTVGICVCEIGKEVILDFLCFDFTAHVNVVKNPEEIYMKALEAKEIRDKITNYPDGAFVVGEFVSLRFFLAHMTMLSPEEKGMLKENFIKLLDKLESEETGEE